MTDTLGSGILSAGYPLEVMRTRKHPLACLFVLALLAWDSAVLWAQPSSFTAISTEKIMELESLHQKATDLLLKNDFEGAIRTYSDILLVEPDDETAYTALGQIYLVLGQYKKSHEAFQNALHINPDNQTAAIGIQSILDPDGVDGLISRDQAETENTTTAPPHESKKIIAVSLAPRAKISARISAMRTKRATEPIAHPKRLDIPSTVKRVKTPRISTKFGRPGRMHAQRVQMALKTAGLYDGPVNGLVGGSTKRALLEFQKQSGLPETGRVTRDTWTLLSRNL